MSALIDRLRESLGDEFDVVRPLGEGSFAEVFLAREKALDRPVAVKVLRGSLARDDVSRQRFLREARLSAKIRHPNVVSVHRVGELAADGRPYLIMEYIDGHTFADILAASGPLDEDEVRRVLTEVCGALDAAHELGIIHRDIRPDNIMQTRDGERIVLADFGLAGVLETGGREITRLTMAGQVLGDLGHAPPEQLDGAAVQPGSDIYALAVTAYELLTGSGPFPGAKSPPDIVRAHLEEEPLPLRRIRPATSPALEDALLRCLQKRPEHRPSATLLRKRLVSSSGGAEAVGEGTVESFLSELRRRRVYKVAAAYGTFILVVLAFVDAALPALPFGMPDWTDSAIVVSTLAGLPVALILAWFYDLTAAGVRRTPSVEGDAPAATRLLLVGALALAMVLAGLVAWLYLRA